MRKARVLSIGGTWLAAAHVAGSAAQAAPASDLTKLSVEELAALRVSIVSRRPQEQRDTPAATAVVTGDDVARSGFTSFAEALRLAPGVQVARASSDAWAVGLRGFASTLSRSMLVMIDGRSVYTPLFAGVYWEQQDVLLADVDRIEVVRGPGGTLWGANAVNGVVNLVTKSSRQTQGPYLEAGGGTTERAFVGARYGGRLGDTATYRVYGKYFDRGAEYHADGADYDDWRLGQGGFRVDWDAGSRGDFKLQGDLYDGRLGQRRTVAQYTPPYREVVDSDARVSGGNLIARWNRNVGMAGRITVRAWYDRTDRTEAYLDESRDTFDVDLHHDFVLAKRNHFVWGLDYRVTADRTSGVPAPFFDPADRTSDLFSGFAQDEIAMAGDRLTLTVGAKLEHNDYSGFEAQPSARLLWAASRRQRVWVAASRAVRTPSRADSDQVQTVFLQEQVPLFVRAVGDKNFESETARVAEAGYRFQPVSQLSFDAAAFYDAHGNLLGGRVGTPFAEPAEAPARVVIPILFGNYLEGETWGGELSFDARPLAGWRMHGAYSYLRMAVRPAEPAPPNLTPDASEGSSPRHQLFLRSAHDLPYRTTVDAFFRYASELSAQKVPAYATLDLRLAWRAVPAVELAVVGQNLLQAHHKEWGGGVEIRRGVYGEVTWRP